MHSLDMLDADGRRLGTLSEQEVRELVMVTTRNVAEYPEMGVGDGFYRTRTVMATRVRSGKRMVTGPATVTIRRMADAGAITIRVDGGELTEVELPDTGPGWQDHGGVVEHEIDDWVLRIRLADAAGAFEDRPLKVNLIRLED